MDSLNQWLQDNASGALLDEEGNPIEEVAEAENEAEVEETEEQPEPEVESEPKDEGDNEAVEDSNDSKKQQSKEENAYFAERRRQEQIERQVQEKLKQSKEYQTTKLLSEMYGVPEEQLYEKLYEAKLAQEAKRQNVPVEYLREREQMRQQQEQLQEQLNNLMFQQWQSRIESEKTQLKSRFNMLSQDDLEQAAYYMLNDLRRTDIPLEQAVFALHGSKILGGLKNTAKNEALAEVSGRKRSPLPVKGGKGQNDAVVLTDEERYIATKLGLTDKEYSKWKEGN